MPRCPSLVLYALAGSSRHLVVGPYVGDGGAVRRVDHPAGRVRTAGRYLALTTALAVATGVAGLLAGPTRLGFVASFISEPVLKGFIVGLALVNYRRPGSEAARYSGKHEGDFFEQTWGVLTHLGETEWRYSCWSGS